MKMKGQTNLFDLVNDGKPCRYRFNRYIGQKVKFWRTGKTGTIVEIEEYYTIVDSKGALLVGTPYDITPIFEGREA